MLEKYIMRTLVTPKAHHTEIRLQELRNNPIKLLSRENKMNMFLR